jgi:hypothetical protein
MGETWYERKLAEEEGRPIEGRPALVSTGLSWYERKLAEEEGRSPSSAEDPEDERGKLPNIAARILRPFRALAERVEGEDPSAWRSFAADVIRNVPYGITPLGPSLLGATIGENVARGRPAEAAEAVNEATPPFLRALEFPARLVGRHLQPGPQEWDPAAVWRATMAPRTHSGAATEALGDMVAPTIAQALGARAGAAAGPVAGQAAATLGFAADILLSPDVPLSMILSKAAPVTARMASQFAAGSARRAAQRAAKEAAEEVVEHAAAAGARTFTVTDDAVKAATRTVKDIVYRVDGAVYDEAQSALGKARGTRTIEGVGAKQFATAGRANPFDIREIARGNPEAVGMWRGILKSNISEAAPMMEPAHVDRYVDTLLGELSAQATPGWRLHLPWVSNRRLGVKPPSTPPLYTETMAEINRDLGITAARQLAVRAQAAEIKASTYVERSRTATKLFGDYADGQQANLFRAMAHTDAEAAILAERYASAADVAAVERARIAQPITESLAPALDLTAERQQAIAQLRAIERERIQAAADAAAAAAVEYHIPAQPARELGQVLLETTVEATDEALELSAKRGEEAWSSARATLEQMKEHHRQLQRVAKLQGDTATAMIEEQEVSALNDILLPKRRAGKANIDYAQGYQDRISKVPPRWFEYRGKTLSQIRKENPYAADRIDKEISDGIGRSWHWLILEPGNTLGKFQRIYAQVGNGVRVSAENMNALWKKFNIKSERSQLVFGEWSDTIVNDEFTTWKVGIESRTGQGPLLGDVTEAGQDAGLYLDDLAQEYVGAMADEEGYRALGQELTSVKLQLADTRAFETEEIVMTEATQAFKSLPIEQQEATIAAIRNRWRPYAEELGARLEELMDEADNLGKPQRATPVRKTPEQKRAQWYKAVQGRGKQLAAAAEYFDEHNRTVVRNAAREAAGAVPGYEETLTQLRVAQATVPVEDIVDDIVTSIREVAPALDERAQIEIEQAVLAGTRTELERQSSRMANLRRYVAERWSADRWAELEQLRENNIAENAILTKASKGAWAGKLKAYFTQGSEVMEGVREHTRDVRAGAQDRFAMLSEMSRRIFDNMTTEEESAVGRLMESADAWFKRSVAGMPYGPDAPGIGATPRERLEILMQGIGKTGTDVEPFIGVDGAIDRAKLARAHPRAERILVAEEEITRLYDFIYHDQIEGRGLHSHMGRLAGNRQMEVPGSMQAAYNRQERIAIIDAQEALALHHGLFEDISPLTRPVHDALLATSTDPTGQQKHMVALLQRGQVNTRNLTKMSVQEVLDTYIHMDKRARLEVGMLDALEQSYFDAREVFATYGVSVDDILKDPAKMPTEIQRLWDAGYRPMRWPGERDPDMTLEQWLRTIGEEPGADPKMVMGLEGYLVPAGVQEHFIAHRQINDYVDALNKAVRWYRRLWNPLQAMALMTTRFAVAQGLELVNNFAWSGALALERTPRGWTAPILRGIKISAAVNARRMESSFARVSPKTAVQKIERWVNRHTGEVVAQSMERRDPKLFNDILSEVSEYGVAAGFGSAEKRETSRFAEFIPSLGEGAKALGEAVFGIDALGRVAIYSALRSEGNTPAAARTILRQVAVEYGADMRAPIDDLLMAVHWYYRYGRHRAEQFVRIAQAKPYLFTIAGETVRHAKDTVLDDYEEIIDQGREPWLKSSLEYLPVTFDFLEAAGNAIRMPALRHLQPTPIIYEVESGGSTCYIRLRAPLLEEPGQWLSTAIHPTDEMEGRLLPPFAFVRSMADQQRGLLKSAERLPVLGPYARLGNKLGWDEALPGRQLYNVFEQGVTNRMPEGKVVPGVILPRKYGNREEIVQKRRQAISEGRDPTAYLNQWEQKGYLYLVQKSQQLQAVEALRAIGISVYLQQHASGIRNLTPGQLEELADCETAPDIYRDQARTQLKNRAKGIGPQTALDQHYR